MEFSADGRIFQKLTYGISGNLFYGQIDATQLGILGLQSTIGLNAKAKLDYRPTDANSAQVTVTRTDKRLTPQGYVSAIDLVNLGYKYQVNSDLTRWRRSRICSTVRDSTDSRRRRRSRKITSVPSWAGFSMSASFIPSVPRTKTGSRASLPPSRSDAASLLETLETRPRPRRSGEPHGAEQLTIKRIVFDDLPGP